MKNISRRNFSILLTFAASGSFFCSSGVFLRTLSAQIIPLRLVLIRDKGWEEMMARNQCIIGQLYDEQSMSKVPGLSGKICNSLELPFRANEKDISSISTGNYKGFIRTDGRLGWRIELSNTSERTNIQIHIGNKPHQTRGCILVGLGEGNDRDCSIGESRAAIDVLKKLHGGSESRPVELAIRS